MFTVFEHPGNFEPLNKETLHSMSQIWEGVASKAQSCSFVSGEEIQCGESDSGDMFRVEQGFVQVIFENRALYFLEPGEIFGNHSAVGPQVRYVCPDKVVASKVPTKTFLENLDSASDGWKKWSDCLTLQRSLLNFIIARSAPEADNPLPVIRSYDPGEPILIQETSPEDVFTLLHGTADVYVNDVKVGEVLSGEIFGALAASTNSRRSASIIASSFCVAAALPSSEFLELIRTHPNTVHEVMASMARIIIAQNEKIVGGG